MSNYQTIYNRLRKAGMTEAGALGCLGNWECESNCEPGRVQGDFSSYRSVSKAYVTALKEGRLTRDAFARDSKGFGLAQWTYWTRKAELYDFCRMQRGEIDSAELQTDFAVKELKRDFKDDWKLLCETRDIYAAVKAVCERFENPAKHNIDARFQAALKVKGMIDLEYHSYQVGEAIAVDDPDAAQPIDPPGVSMGDLAPGWEKIPATSYWPCRGMRGGKDDPGLCNGMNGNDTVVLQAILMARGWPVHCADGAFGLYLEDIVKEFQEAYGLTADGIVGPKTWAKLMEVRA